MSWKIIKSEIKEIIKDEHEREDYIPAEHLEKLFYQNSYCMRIKKDDFKQLYYMALREVE